MTGAPDFAALRREFPTLARWTYLDVARKAPLPRCAEAAMQDFCRDVFENAGAAAWAAEALETTRATMARVYGAKPEEISFIKNTTEGLNIAAHAFEGKPGDNIVLTDMEHVNNIWVWKHWEAKGLELRVVRSRDGRLPVEGFLQAIDERTRVVACTYVAYGNGYRVNLPELGRTCRERGIRLVVDGVQGIGILARPLSALGADMIAVGGHKGLLGLTGSGILYTREELIREAKTEWVRPVSMLKSAAFAGVGAVHDAHRFEGGNPNFIGLWVFRQSAEFVESIGLAAIERRVRELSTTLLDLLAQRGISTQTPAEWDERCHIVNLRVPDAAKARRELWDQRIVVNVKDGWLRASVGFFNDEEDLERLVQAVSRHAPR